MKKLISLIMVLAMLFSLSLVAFAEFVPSINEKPAPDIVDTDLDCEHTPIDIVPVSDDDASDELKDLYEELQDKGADDLPTDKKDPLITHLVEVNPGCDDAEDKIDNDGTIKITLNIGENAEDTDVLAYVQGAWRNIPVTYNGDGTITITISAFGPLAFVISGQSTPVTGDTDNAIFLWGSLMVLSLALIPTLTAVYLKNNKKAANTEE